MKESIKNLTKIILTFAIVFLIHANLFSQVVTVNGSVSQNYPDLTSAFNAINLGIHGSGAISVLINQSHILSSVAVLNGNVFTTCEIKPTADVAIDGILSNALIILDGADNVTIDGRIGAINDIKLTLANIGGCIEMKNGASNNTIKFVYCNSDIFETSVKISPSLPGTGGSNNSLIEQCHITGIINSEGSSGAAGYVNDGLKVLKNDCSWIILRKETRNFEIKNNKVTGGIVIYGVGSINIIENKIFPGSVSIDPYDLTAPGSNNTEINIINNFICTYVNIGCGGLRCYFFGVGLRLTLGNITSNTNSKIIFNTITFEGHFTGGAFIEIVDTRGLEIYIPQNTNHNVVVKNNIVKNNAVVNGNTSNTGIYSVGGSITAFGGTLVTDYNCFFSSGNISNNMAGYLVGSNWITTSDINAYRTLAFPNEQHSIFKDANYADISNGDLHLAGSSIGDIELKGVQIPGITNDIDNQIRISPYRGADEAPDFPLPVELASFTSSVNNADVLLKWTTLHEQGNSGFEIERKVAGANSEWLFVNFVRGNGNSNSLKNYSYEDKNLSTGKYSYRLKQMDFNGNFEYHDLSNEVIIGAPEKFMLFQNYPNPFNPVTNIHYDLPFNNFVTLKIYDLLGKQAAELVNESQLAGSYTISFDGSNLPSGIYYYKLTAGGYVQVRKMILLK